MQPIEHAARISVARACGFGLVAVGTFMVGFSAQMPLAFKFGGLCLLLMCAILVLKAVTVARQPYRSTETWLILAKADRPSADVAQQLITGVLRDVYLEHARLSALGAAGLFAASLLLGLFAKH